MAWTVPASVLNGASFSETHTIAYRAAIIETQTALAIVRRRDSRNTTTYGVGTTDLVPNATAENLGGITTSGGVLTLPASNVYQCSVVFNQVTAPGTDDWLELVLTRGADTYYGGRVPLSNTTDGTLASWSTYIFGTDTVKFRVIIGTTAVDATWETCVSAVNHILP